MRGSRWTYTAHMLMCICLCSSTSSPLYIYMGQQLHRRDVIRKIDAPSFPEKKLFTVMFLPLSSSSRVPTYLPLPSIPHPALTPSLFLSYIQSDWWMLQTTEPDSKFVKERKEEIHYYLKKLIIANPSIFQDDFVTTFFELLTFDERADHQAYLNVGRDRQVDRIAWIRRQVDRQVDRIGRQVGRPAAGLKVNMKAIGVGQVGRHKLISVTFSFLPLPIPPIYIHSRKQGVSQEVVASLLVLLLMPRPWVLLVLIISNSIIHHHHPHQQQHVLHIPV